MGRWEWSQETNTLNQIIQQLKYFDVTSYSVWTDFPLFDNNHKIYTNYELPWKEKAKTSYFTKF